MRRSAALLLLVFVGGCGVFRSLPDPTGVRDRLAALPRSGMPLDEDVRIHWDDHQIPFVEAKTDHDAAFALGLVHAHLRLGQLEIFRRAAQGRLSESGGPFVTEIDHALRILDLAKRAPEIEAQLPDQTRAWLTAFVDGLNFYQDHMSEAPLEYDVLDLEVEPWTVQDLLTASRVATADVNWLTWVRLLKLRDHPEWPALWRRLRAAGASSHPSFDGRADALDALISNGRSGSNSFVVDGRFTKSGAPLIANDPHLGFQLPNFWLIAGVSCPSVHAVGLMIPGIPAVALGRNEVAAWGGTNMRAASSDLVRLPNPEVEVLDSRTETLRVRWWSDEELEVRQTRFGPVLSDAEVIGWEGEDALVLRWIGHRASDEVTALLRMNQAEGFEAFRAAFGTFAVSGQNYLYAHRDGTIGQVMAAHLPVRTATVPEDIWVSPEDTWRGVRTAAELPAIRNPKAGLLVSANNRPAHADVPVGYFFAGNDRVDRLTELVRTSTQVDLEVVRGIQTDVFMASSLSSALRLRALVERAGGRWGPDAQAVLRDLEAFDGTYEADARPPLVFELMIAALFDAHFEPRFEGEALAALAGLAGARDMLLDELEALSQPNLRVLLAEAIDAVLDRAEPEETWGDQHRLVLGHPLANAPLIGDRYRVLDAPASGSAQTVMKTAHGLVRGEHKSFFGAQARHVSDLSDPDANWFVLLGGQDGWLNSDTFADQAELFLKAEYVQVPLRIEAVRARFEHETVLTR